MPGDRQGEDEDERRQRAAVSSAPVTPEESPVTRGCSKAVGAPAAGPHRPHAWRGHCLKPPEFQWKRPSDMGREALPPRPERPPSGDKPSGGQTLGGCVGWSRVGWGEDESVVGW